MREKVSIPIVKDASAKRKEPFQDAAEAYKYFTGETMSADQAADAFWYVRLRQRMIARRKEVAENQAKVASAMGTSQSEVSRLENGLGPGTRLGTLRTYLAACGTSLEDLIASLDEGSGADLREDREEPDEKSKMRLVIEGHEFVGVEAKGVLEALHALNNLLRRSSLDRQERKGFILGFLHELAGAREDASSRPSRDFDVRVTAPDDDYQPLLKNITMVDGTSALSVSDFRRTIAEPLDLSDF